MGCSASKPSEPANSALPAAPVQKKKVEPEPPKPAPEPVEVETTPQEPEPVKAAPQPEPQKPVEPPPKVVAVEDDTNEAYGLLLCGAGESGKTTFTRQLKLRYLNGFNEKDCRDFLRTIRGNLVETMQLLLVWLEHNSIEIEDEDAASMAQEIVDVDPQDCEFNEELVDKLKILWENEQIKKAFEHKDETAVPDHMPYFFDKIDQLAEEDYIPSNEDVLRARIRSIGIEAITFDLQGARIRIFDVGGQKSERSKWANVMDQVEGVIFCVSFAEFDKPMFEDQNVLRINDSLEIFSNITHQEKFANSPIFLVCNKFDVFEEKIKNTDAFIKIFPEFTGDSHNPEVCAQYLIQKFLDKAAPLSEDRPIVEYKIVALNGDQVVQTADAICKYISDKYYQDA